MCVCERGCVCVCVWGGRVCVCVYVCACERGCVCVHVHALCLLCTLCKCVRTIHTYLFLQLRALALNLLQVGLELGDLGHEGVRLLQGLAGLLLGRLAVHLLLLQVFLDCVQPTLQTTFVFRQTVTVSGGTKVCRKFIVCVLTYLSS